MAKYIHNVVIYDSGRNYNMSYNFKFENGVSSAYTTISSLNVALYNYNKTKVGDKSFIKASGGYESLGVKYKIVGVISNDNGGDYFRFCIWKRTTPSVTAEYCNFAQPSYYTLKDYVVLKGEP